MLNRIREAIWESMRNINIESILDVFEGFSTAIQKHEHDKLWEEISAHHVYPGIPSNEALFEIVENILKHATQTVDKIVQGTQVHVENIEQKTLEVDFNIPLYKLNCIAREMPCEPDLKVFHYTTLEILNKLSNYSWEAKAVLTLAAFAMEYGEFWLLAQGQESDQLAKSISILKGVPFFLKPTNLQKRRQELLAVNNLIKVTMQVIGIFCQFEKLSSYDTKDVPELASAREQIPMDAYRAIMTLVACATKVTLLTGDEDKKHDLVPYDKGINSILKRCNEQLITCKQQVEAAKRYWRIKKILGPPTEIKEVFKALFCTHDGQPQLRIDGFTKQTVHIDIPTKKNILLFLSSLEISDDDISILKPIYESIKRDNQGKIVWIPIVEQWTHVLGEKFASLKLKMPWDTVQISAPEAGIRFIKEEWNFKGKPILVVISPRGKVENSNAFHMIRVWGPKSSPFTQEKEKELSDSPEGFGNLIREIYPNLPNLMKKDEYNFFYGGKDKEWMKQFKGKATALANDLILKEAKVNIKFFCVGKDSKGEDDFGILRRFWTGIESLFHTKINKKADSATLEIEKLLSCKNESGWAVLSKGSSLVVAGHGISILKVIEDFDKWKGQVKEEGFENSFKTYHAKIGLKPSFRLDIQDFTGKLPDTVNCPHCNLPTDTFISYQCCHSDGPNVQH